MSSSSSSARRTWEPISTRSRRRAGSRSWAPAVGADASVSLRHLMGRRGRIFGTMLRARPLEEKALAVQAFAREVVPLLATGAVRPLVDRVFPADDVHAAFDRLAAPGKLGKVLLAF